MLRLLVVAGLAVVIQGAALPALKRHPNVKSIFHNGKIVGGQETTIDKVPWQVALEDQEFLFCGGSIISKNYILTAAHCTDGFSAQDIIVRSGTSRLEFGGTLTKVAAIAQNPDFTFDDLDSDIAVLKLASSLVLDDNQKTVTLRKKEAIGNESAQVSGFGTTSVGGSFSKVLKIAQVPIVDRQECSDIYGAVIAKSMICAGLTGDGACQADSGGALTINNAQVGVISWSLGCGEPDYPSINANIATLVDFINENSNNEAQWV